MWSHRHAGTRIVLAAVLLAVLLTALSGYDMLRTIRADRHSGMGARESGITSRNIGGLHQFFKATLPATADSASLFLAGVTTERGMRDLLFVTTLHGQLIALDARAGSLVWMAQDVSGDCRINDGERGATLCYTTAAPALDPNHQYIYSYGLDGSVHKYRVGDGEEITGDGWPELATAKPDEEKGSTALTTATVRNGVSYLYVAQSGYWGDHGDYQGHLTTIDLATGSQHVFNAMCSDQVDVHFRETPDHPDCDSLRSGIWGRGGVAYDPETDRVYLATGNGVFDPARHLWGNSVLALNPDGTGVAGDPLDSYTPANARQLNIDDEDLGTSVPVLLPPPPNSKIGHLMLQVGKDRKLRILNRDDLSLQGGPGHVGGELSAVITVPQGGQVISTPAMWANPDGHTVWVIVATAKGIAGFQLIADEGGIPQLKPVWQTANGGTSPVIVNGIVFSATSNDLCALDVMTGTELWHDDTIGTIHWETPLVVNDMVYLTDSAGNLSAYTTGT